MELFDGEDTTIFASDWPHHDFDHPIKLNRSRSARRSDARSSARTPSSSSASTALGRAMTEVVVGRLADFPDGTHKVVEAAGREIGVFNIGGRSTGCRTSAPTRPARCARPRGDRHAGGRSRQGLEHALGHGRRGDRLPVARPRVPRADRAVPRLSRDHAAALPGRRCGAPTSSSPSAARAGERPARRPAARPLLRGDPVPLPVADDPSPWVSASSTNTDFPPARWAPDKARTHHTPLGLSCASSRRPPAASDQ